MIVETDPGDEVCDEHPDADVRFVEAADAAPIDHEVRCAVCDKVIDAL